MVSLGDIFCILGYTFVPNKYSKDSGINCSPVIDQPEERTSHEKKTSSS